MSPPKDPHHASTSPQKAEFTFVSDETKHGARSHAMREHWKQRKHRQSIRKSKDKASILNPPALRPMNSGESSTAISDHSTSVSSNSVPRDDENLSQNDRQHKRKSLESPNEEDPLAQMMGSIHAQALAGMNLALGCGKLDPFDKFPVKFTARHHQLLHHWLVTYATMMFDRLSASGFNPMRDVWMPLDLSNEASFNALLAHSAAHLARMQGHRTSDTALKFKTEAIRIVTEWMSDAELCMSDDIIAAVLRLLTYERYWGTEAEWHVHYDGLQRLIEARGGIEALQSNWRVGLPTYLVSLMSKPSWFDTSNQIWELSEQPHSSFAGNSNTLHRIRCLWLLSFVQDIGTFVCNNPGIYSHGLTNYPAVLEALLMLHNAYCQSRGSTPSEDNSTCSSAELRRLACLLFICCLVQNNFEASGGSMVFSHAASMEALDVYLNECHQLWAGSPEGLYELLFNKSTVSGEEVRKIDYVLQMATVLGSLSIEARNGVENCLTHIMCQPSGGFDDGGLDDTRTPDSLLASIHGD